MFRSSLSTIKILGNQAQRRWAGGFIKKNIRAEENAGMREISYRTWVFDNTSMFRITAYMLIPGAIFYFLVIDENKMRDEQTGRKANYGLF